MPYIRRIARGPSKCIFCAALDRRRDGPSNLILERGPACFAILNRYPYSPGHAMVAPIRHVGAVARLTPQERTEMWERVARVQAALDRAFRPHGYNIGINLGRVAGAGVPGHLHLHIVPRWRGDTNFMPAIAGAKVIPMSLAESYRRVQAAMGSQG
jgi:ATP adenylyltransferase